MKNKERTIDHNKSKFPSECLGLTIDEHNKIGLELAERLGKLSSKLGRGPWISEMLEVILEVCKGDPNAIAIFSFMSGSAGKHDESKLKEAIGSLEELKKIIEKLPGNAKIAVVDASDLKEKKEEEKNPSHEDVSDEFNELLKGL